MLRFRLIAILGALAFTGAAQGQEAIALLNTNEPAPVTTLVGRLTHYPNDIVQVIFDASQYPEQIALAARYLNDPSNIQGKPEFNRAILALMQYPTLLQRLSTDLVWVSELGQALTEDETLVWAQLKDQRLLPKDLGQPETVAQKKTRVVYRSRPSTSGCFDYDFFDPWPPQISESYVVHWDRHSHRRLPHRWHHHPWGYSDRYSPFWHDRHLHHQDRFLYWQQRRLERKMTRERRRANRREFRQNSRRHPHEPYKSGTVFGTVQRVDPLH